MDKIFSQLYTLALAIYTTDKNSSWYFPKLSLAKQQEQKFNQVLQSRHE